MDAAGWKIYGNGGYGDRRPSDGSRYSLYNTNQFVADALVYTSLQSSAIWNLDCSQADAVIVPVISSAFFTQSRRPELVSIYGNLSLHLPYLDEKPHFAILGFIEECVADASHHSFNHQVEGILDSPHPNMWFGVLEKRLNWSKRYSTIDIPYPVGLHFDSPVIPSDPALNFNEKSLLIFTTWESKTDNRKQMVKHCEESGKSLCVHFENHYDSYNASAAQSASESALFCPQPGGDSPSRSQTWNALVTGCIPVVFDNAAELPMPFSSRIPWDDVILRFPYFDGTISYVEVIKSFFEDHRDLVQEKQRNIAKLRHVFQYSLNPALPQSAGWTLEEAAAISSTDDAITLILKEFLIAATLFNGSP